LHREVEGLEKFDAKKIFKEKQSRATLNDKLFSKEGNQKVC